MRKTWIQLTFCTNRIIRQGLRSTASSESSLKRTKLQLYKNLVHLSGLELLARSLNSGRILSLTKNGARPVILVLGLQLAIAPNLARAAIYNRNGNKIPDTDVNSLDVSWDILSSERDKKYNGVGLLGYEDKGFCTAFFLDSHGDNHAPAYAISNGHCYGINRFPDAEEIVINQPSDLVFKLNYFANDKNQVRSVAVKKVVYATMKDTDIMILELNTSFKQLVKEGFTPFKIAKDAASINEPVEVIGIPITGVKSSRSFLHRAVCEVGQAVNLREGIYHWKGAIRTRCSLVGGMSGSPVVSQKSDRVIAIANTGVDDDALSQPECSRNRPCEISNDGKVSTFPQENYAQRVSDIPSCFDSKGLFNLSLPSCQLEKP